MREHMGLFRGKRLDNGGWIIGNLWMRCGDPHIISPGNSVGVEVDPDTVGECTGKSDKTGKPIFEGDIVKTERDLFCGENKKKREIFNSVVFYDTVSACFGLKSNKYRCLTLRRFEGDFDKVIGNIHDNPELLKERTNDGRQI